MSERPVTHYKRDSSIEQQRALDTAANRLQVDFSKAVSATA